MKVIVDANIVFSGILNTNGKIGDLLLNSNELITFISARYMSSEVIRYYSRIQKLTGKTTEEIERIHLKILKKTTSISEDQIPKETWEKAFNLMKEIDVKDTPYLAFSEYLDLKIWTGDKILRQRLLEKGYDRTVTTDELFRYRESLIRK